MNHPFVGKLKRPFVWSVCAALLVACGNQPRTPDWQLETRSALERMVSAYLQGNARVEQAEYERARREAGATGKLDLLARVELTRCAARVASLVLEPCSGFETLRRDAPAAERAYADYLAGRALPTDAALLPAPHRAVASGLADAATYKAIEEPLSRLIAAGVLFQTGRASPEVIANAAETASQQGWRRPLLAWLGVQVQRADAAGAKDDAARIRRRIALVLGEL